MQCHTTRNTTTMTMSTTGASVKLPLTNVVITSSDVSGSGGSCNLYCVGWDVKRYSIQSIWRIHDSGKVIRGLHQRITFLKSSKLKVQSINHLLAIITWGKKRIQSVQMAGTTRQKLRLQLTLKHKSINHNHTTMLFRNFAFGRFQAGAILSSKMSLFWCEQGYRPRPLD